MTAPCARDSELETSSYTVRHVENSRSRPCGHLCFYFEETFNLQIPCQEGPSVVVAEKLFSLPRILVHANPYRSSGNVSSYVLKHTKTY